MRTPRLKHNLPSLLRLQIIGVGLKSVYATRRISQALLFLQNRSIATQSGNQDLQGLNPCRRSETIHTPHGEILIRENPLEIIHVF